MPGPTVMLVVSHALNGGRRTALGSVPGTMLGDFTAMTVSLAGAGAVLAASATLFTALKLVGAAYLIWLGVRLWRAKPDPSALDLKTAPAGMRSVFLQAFVVTALNPKGIVFFVAFVPQFVDPAAPALMQFVVLEATFVVMAGINVGFWALAAGTLRQRFRRPSTLRLVNRIGGGFLIGAGLLTAAVRRA